MSGVIAVQRAGSQLRYLKQMVENFEGFHAANFTREINQFCDFFTQDDVIGLISRALFQRIPTSPQAYQDRVQASGVVEALPEEPVAAFAFRWGILRLIRRGKVDLRFFVSNHFPGAHLNEMMMNWKRLIVHPFAEDCRTISDGLQERLGDDDWVRFEALVADYLDGPFAEVGFGPRAWNDDDDDAAEGDESAPATKKPSAGTTPSLSGALSALEAAVNAIHAPARDDLLRDVAALRLEVTRRDVEGDRIRRRLESMAKAEGTLAAPCSEVEAAL